MTGRIAELPIAQRRMLAVARAGAGPRGIIPSVKMLEFVLQLSPSGNTTRTLQCLEDKGWITRENGVRVLSND